ncbi:MAG: transglycosylase SLT domain-containing protein [bacterium]|nr:transglycosylase SLT domain-containing protein [bacterium]
MTYLLVVIMMAGNITAPAPPAAQGFVAKHPRGRAGRLATYIVKINPKAEDYADRLAGAILDASHRYQVDPNLLAAICWNESYFQLEAPGSSGERGPWQIMRMVGLMSGAWNDLVQAMYGLPDFPDADWDGLSREDQTRALRDPVLATYMAAFLMAWHKGRCDYPTTARCYARYNSGGPQIRWGYARALGRRAANVRRAVDADIE